MSELPMGEFGNGFSALVVNTILAAMTMPFGQPKATPSLDRHLVNPVAVAMGGG
jgi:hypothetical protein